MSILKEQLTSGLWDGGRCIIRNPRFTRLPEYMDGQRVIMVADLYLPDEDGQTLEQQRFSIGQGWIASDDETEITGHEDGKKLKLNNGTGLGRFVDSLAEAGGDELENVLVERQKAGATVSPFHVSLYDGLDVVVEGHEQTFKGADGSEGTQRWFAVTEYNGYETAGAGAGGGAKPAKAAAKKATKAVAKKAASKPAAKPEVNPTDGIDEAVVEMIRAVARGSEDYDEFMATCYADIAEVADDETYQALVDDASETGIWGQVCAEFAAEE